MTDNPACEICGYGLRDHVVTKDGPLTCPRTASGEGTYELVSAGYTMSGCLGGFPGADDIDIPPTYRFVPKKTAIQ